MTTWYYTMRADWPNPATRSAAFCQGATVPLGTAAVLRDPVWHVTGRSEHRVVHVDDRPERFDIGRGAQPGCTVGRRAVPGSLAFLQQPQAHHVAQVADRAVDAGLVGEVG